MKLKQYELTKDVTIPKGLVLFPSFTDPEIIAIDLRWNIEACVESGLLKEVEE